ncbi:nucleoside-diphosphate kinase [Neoaquamicrobium sediminum]|uniref:nucleoside-diphosphate kinase n=1 Tax=Neoaquamicrobium sediminum TaxID=1849104 RepID=UPI001D92A20F|nr:nucleoside-diphosphate kinase [Mesorhizobium sp.]
MSAESCILTTKDFTILEVMRDRCLGREDPLALLLKRKLDSALVVFRDDVPANVATLSSRVNFSVNGGERDTRVISDGNMSAPVGLFLPISNPRGLALLGLIEGQEFCFTDPDRVERRVMLEQVLYQPEAVRREKEAMSGLSRPATRRPVLRLVHSAGGAVRQPVPAGPEGFDDPGPSAA